MRGRGGAQEVLEKSRSGKGREREANCGCDASFSA